MNEELGRGPVARVYRATDSLLEVERAIKVLPPAFASLPETLERFRREARALARIRHPNVVVVHDVGVDAGYAYLVMELMEGRTLRDAVLTDGALPWADAVRSTREVLAGLGAAHAAGVIHRNVRPENVFLDRGTARLTDFGLARENRENLLTVTGEALGAWPYAPPEQMKDAHAVDARADIYATGATLYFALTRREPAHLQVASEHARLMRGVHEGVAAVIVRATRSRPDDRWPDAASMDAALAAL